MLVPKPIHLIPSGEYAIVFLQLIVVLPPTAIVGCCIFTLPSLAFQAIPFPEYSNIVLPNPVHVIPSGDVAIV